MNGMFKHIEDSALVSYFFCGPSFKTREQNEAIERELVWRGYDLERMRARVASFLGDLFKDTERWCDLQLPPDRIAGALQDLENRQAGLFISG